MVVVKNGVEFKACACGCGEAVSPKSLYKPGHDARHAGQIGREAARQVLDGQFKRPSDSNVINALPTEHLRVKALRIANNSIDKERMKASRQTIAIAAAAQINREEQAAVAAVSRVEGFRHGTVKVGRWDYPARMTNAGKVERNSKRDGSGSWEPVGSATAAQTATWDE